MDPFFINHDLINFWLITVLIGSKEVDDIFLVLSFFYRILVSSKFA